MRSISVFLDISKSVDFQRKISDVNRAQEVFHVIHTFFGSSLGKYSSTKFHHCRICVKDFSEGEGELFASIHESTALEFFYLKNAAVCGSFKKDNESSEKKHHINQI